MTAHTPPTAIEWVGELDGYIAILDQTLLPTQVATLQCREASEVADAINRLAVRGAPAIGIAAAMGVVLGVRNASVTDRGEFFARLDQTCRLLRATRPTAVNLSWALDRMVSVAHADKTLSVAEIKTTLLTEARRIADEDAAMCRAIGEAGQSLINDGAGVLTHCNAGALATGGCGTALAPMYVAHELGRRFRVYADETRPLLQGARLTAWELTQADIDVTVLCDNMAASLMASGRVDLVITGADRIAANGDVANKIGTYGVALLAHAHGIPFYVAAPSTTFDLTMATGAEIPIEERGADEIRRGFGRQTVPDNVACYCPAFDVTPAERIRGIITDRGLIEPVRRETINAVLG